MQESIISWTQQTWNPVFGCSKVSDGCKYCYAATIAEKFGHTSKPWTIQNEAENVQIKPHKLAEVYKLKTPTRIFVNSMSDMFHRQIPDWYLAAMFCVMLDRPQHTFQILTKRPQRAIDWHVRFVAALHSPEFQAFRDGITHKQLKVALGRNYETPWQSHIWMGTSIEDARVLQRLKELQNTPAITRFISAEPLIGAWGAVDLSGIHWVIVGGESGKHLTPDHPRWLNQAWAREIKEQCVKQGVAFFMKQDSGQRTELRTYLVEEDGSKWKWEQYPGDLKPPTRLDDGGRVAQIQLPI